MWQRAFHATIGASDRYRQFIRIIDTTLGWELSVCADCGLLSKDPLSSERGLVCQADCIDAYRYCDSCEILVVHTGHPCFRRRRNPVCEPSHPIFTFPVNGGEIANDTPFDVEVAGGTISEAGMRNVLQACATTYHESSRNYDPWYRFDSLFEGLEPTWQTKTGNFTKRIAKLALQSGWKLQPELLTQIGNIARENCSRDRSIKLEFTRRLNESAGYFYHANSCWWESYHRSRCALKQCGGLAIRSFHQSGRQLNGRAWLMPLTKEGGQWEPTHETRSDAYVLFNAYGLGFTEFGRIVAGLVGYSYGKIPFACEPMFVNAGGGILIAPQSIIDDSGGINLFVNVQCGHAVS
jgi:hypothetical protein